MPSVRIAAIQPRAASMPLMIASLACSPGDQETRSGSRRSVVRGQRPDGE
jgi:hypothetical protein